MRPPGRTTRASSAKMARRSVKFRSAKPHVTPSTEASGIGSAAAVGLDAGEAPRRGGQHAEAEVDADRDQSALGELGGQVAGAAGQVDHHATRGQPERRDRPPTPPDVHPEGHDPVHQVVAGGDHVEHRPHRAGLVVAGGQWLVGSRDERSAVGGGHRRQPTSAAACCPSRRRSGPRTGPAAYTPTMSEQHVSTAGDDGDEVVPAPIHIDEAALDDLRQRLGRTRLPDAETVADWSQGLPLADARELRTTGPTPTTGGGRGRINGFGPARTTIDGLGIHFVHRRSPHPDAVPLVLTHGWPGSIVEFLEVIEPAHRPDRPRRQRRGRVPRRGAVAARLRLLRHPDHDRLGASTASPRLGRTLMRRLGYERFGAQGGRLGLDGHHRARCSSQRRTWSGIHLKMPIVVPTRRRPRRHDPGGGDARRRSSTTSAGTAGYSTQQSTRPQTLGYGLADSPVGQAAWVSRSSGRGRITTATLIRLLTAIRCSTT